MVRFAYVGFLAFSALGAAACDSPTPARGRGTLDATASASAPHSGAALPAAAASSGAPAPAAVAETAPQFAPPPAKPGTPPVYRFGATVTLEGVFFPPEEGARDEKDSAACHDPVRLAYAIHIKKADGTEVAPGGVTRVCIWSWMGRGEQGNGPRPPMLQRGGRVTVRGELSPRIRSHHPNAVLLFDAVVVSAGPPATTAPPGAFADGESFAFLRQVDASTRTVALDLAFLYYGEEAKLAAAARGATLPPGRPWFVVNDGPQLRSVRLPEGVYPRQLRYENGGGWHHVPIEELASEAEAASKGRGGAEKGRPVFVTIKNGEVAPSSGEGGFSIVNLF